MTRPPFGVIPEPEVAIPDLETAIHQSEVTILDPGTAILKPEVGIPGPETAIPGPEAAIPKPEVAILPPLGRFPTRVTVPHKAKKTIFGRRRKSPIYQTRILSRNGVSSIDAPTVRGDT
ncbi:hypothetical protein EU245_11440 [Lentibacillus lipolyticus]|nr:hypothetical protein EU245_11440 [Lentibacillus lipolyticus]